MCLIDIQYTFLPAREETAATANNNAVILSFDLWSSSYRVCELNSSFDMCYRWVQQQFWCVTYELSLLNSFDVIHMSWATVLMCYRWVEQQFWCVTYELSNSFDVIHMSWATVLMCYIWIEQQFLCDTYELSNSFNVLHMNWATVFMCYIWV